MIRLLQAELFLIFRQRRTYYGLAAILIIELFIVAGAWYQGNEIIEVLLDNLSRNFYLQGKLLNGHLVMYIVLNGLWFNLPLIIMIIVSGFLTNDYKDKTIQTIMLQSIDKNHYIMVKYLAAVIFTLLVLLFLTITAGIMSYAIFGQGDLITYLNNLNFLESDVAFIRIGWAFVAGGILMIFYSVTSLTFAVIFKEMTITWIASALFLIMCNLLLKTDFGVANQWFFPKLIDTWQYFFYFNIPWKSILINHIILLIYAAMFWILGIIIFIKRDIG